MRLTNTQDKFIKDTSQTSEFGKMQQRSDQKNFQTLTYFVQDFHANHSQLWVQNKASMIFEVLCFMKSSGLLKRNTPKLLFLKTSKVCLTMLKEKLLKQSSKHWMNWGMMQNGVCLTVKTSYRKIEKDYSLSDFLETHNGLNQWETYSKSELILRDGRDNRTCLRAGRVLEIGIKGKSIRRLTPKESERLQGLSDGWTEGIPNTQRYKCIGNSITIPILERLIDSLSLDKE